MRIAIWTNPLDEARPMLTLDLADYLHTSYAYLVEEHEGSADTIRRAAEAVQVYRDGEVVSVRNLYDAIVATVVGEIQRFACVAEPAEAAAARRVFQLADELDETAARALLTAADLLDADLMEIEADAAEAWREAAEAMYGSAWD